DFAQLARTYSKGSTAAEGGDLGQYKRGALGKVIEDQVFPLKAGESTAPIRTKQGYILLKVTEHTQGGIPQFKDVEQDVEQNYYMSRMEPAIRDYLTKMREDADIEIKPGFVDTGASPSKQVFPIAYSAYTAPTSKKKKKVERTRFRETARGYRQTAAPVAAAAPATTATTTAPAKKAATTTATLKPGKKEKIRYGRAPQETLPDTPALQTEDAGATATQQTASSVPEPANPLEANEEATKKTRFSDRAREPKQPKGKAKKEQKDSMTPSAPEAGEVADRQTQSASLGLGGDTASKKKKKSTTTASEKTRISDRAKQPAEPQTGPQAAPQPTPIPPVQGAPAPEPAQQPQP
ncbi:MAG: peptidylprolyl isomerase, partial [Terracidiphilus sp.]